MEFSKSPRLFEEIIITSDDPPVLKIKARGQTICITKFDIVSVLNALRSLECAIEFSVTEDDDAV